MRVPSRSKITVLKFMLIPVVPIKKNKRAFHRERLSWGYIG
jgi:hypothetical protein